MRSIRKALLRIPEIFGIHAVQTGDLSILETVKRDLLLRDYEPHENFIPQGRIGNAGFSLNLENQLKLLASFSGPDFQELFRILRSSEEINAGSGGVDYKDRDLIHNGYYPTPDAELYAAMISTMNPARIIEVGSGYSTLIARAAVEHARLECEIHIIDPLPRRDIENYADRIEYKPVEESSLVDLELAPDTLLFIDSSHVCRSGGDLPFLYCRVLPALPPGVLVHVHDIFIPYDYPDNYFERFYTEGYLLHALLANSSKFEVVLSTHNLSRNYKEPMQAAFGPSVGEDPLFFGASFWIKSVR